MSSSGHAFSLKVHVKSGLQEGITEENLIVADLPEQI